ncbi:MAG TPA: protein kinase [Acidimicrobiales bacterium]|jgi:serine/threonine-protein kinase PknK|nr:protein kinase [Acidimicrobiales bacterium]
MTDQPMSPRSADLGIPGIEGLEQVARGGFGVVFRGRQEHFRRTVAVKVLDSTPDAKTLARFEQECQALGALSGHPNIVSIFDAGSTPDGRPFLIMPYLPGGSLADRLAARGPFPWPEMLDTGVKLAGALTTAHEAGLLHRDIKPENVLRSQYSEPLLADFGLARVQGLDMSQSTTILATPAHVAPEVLSGQPATTSSDVYSLGSTLFALLYGGPAFVRPGDEHVLAVMARLATEPPPDLRPMGVPDLLCRVLEWCMQKQPAHRPASARTLGEALQRAQAQLGVPVTPLPVVSPPDPHQLAGAFSSWTPAPAVTPAPESGSGGVSPVPVPGSGDVLPGSGGVSPVPVPGSGSESTALASAALGSQPTVVPPVARSGAGAGAHDGEAPPASAPGGPGAIGPYTWLQVGIAVAVLALFLTAGLLTGLAV